MIPELRYDTFLSLPPEDCTYEQSRVVLLRVPYDATASYEAGARRGPAAIMAASAQIETYDLELDRDPAEVGIHTLPILAPSSRGPEEMVAQVEAICRAQLDAGKFLVLIGGEHSVAYGAIRAHAAREDKLTVLQIDAHLDLRDSYEGSPYSHASVARRALSHAALVQVGVRAACPEEMEVLRTRGLKPVWGHEAARLSPQELVTRVLPQLGPRVYVTLDVDGLDPSVIPATGTPVPGGLGWYQTLALLRAVGEQRQVVGCDLCELSPLPGQPASDFAAAQLVYKMIGYFVS